MTNFTRPLENLGRVTVQSLAGIGHAGMLLLESCYFVAAGGRRGQPVRLSMVFEQMRQIGVDAL
ncbi:MAG: ABC transporter permease, partial [Rudaea sp.]